MPDTINSAQPNQTTWSIEQMQRLDTLADDMVAAPELGAQIDAILLSSVRDRLFVDVESEGSRT